MPPPRLEPASELPNPAAPEPGRGWGVKTRLPDQLEILLPTPPPGSRSRRLSANCPSGKGSCPGTEGDDFLVTLNEARESHRASRCVAPSSSGGHLRRAWDRGVHRAASGITAPRTFCGTPQASDAYQRPLRPSAGRPCAPERSPRRRCTAGSQALAASFSLPLPGWRSTGHPSGQRTAGHGGQEPAGRRRRG